MLTTSFESNEEKSTKDTRNAGTRSGERSVSRECAWQSTPCERGREESEFVDTTQKCSPSRKLGVSEGHCRHDNDAAEQRRHAKPRHDAADETEIRVRVCTTLDALAELWPKAHSRTVPRNSSSQ